jgi:hypothetical protein
LGLGRTTRTGATVLRWSAGAQTVAQSVQRATTPASAVTFTRSTDANNWFTAREQD